MTCTYAERKLDATEPVLCDEPSTVRAPDGRERCYDHAKMCPCGNPSVDGTCAGHAHAVLGDAREVGRRVVHDRVLMDRQLRLAHLLKAEDAHLLIAWLLQFFNGVEDVVTIPIVEARAIRHALKNHAVADVSAHMESLASALNRIEEAENAG